MNAQIATEELVAKLTALAKNYKPKLPRRYRRLMPFKDCIIELRRKDASYRVIAQVLQESGVPVAVTSVRQFYLEIVEQKALRAKARSQLATAVTQSVQEVSPKTAADVQQGGV